jgi:hypothetical protein
LKTPFFENRLDKTGHPGLGLQIEEEKHGGPRHWACSTNGAHFAIHDAKDFSEHTHPANLKSNVSHLFFTIEDMNEFLSHIKNLGIELMWPIEDVGPMKMATVRDPDA